jgi:hypothetical protein
LRRRERRGHQTRALDRSAQRINLLIRDFKEIALVSRGDRCLSIGEILPEYLRKLQRGQPFRGGDAKGAAAVGLGRPTFVASTRTR